MIVVCEFMIRDSNHETLNAGMLYGISLCYPNEEILFYATKEHIDAVSGVLHGNCIDNINITWCPVDISASSSLIEILKCYILMRKILKNTIKNKCNYILFLSSMSYLMVVLKKIHRIYAKNMNFIFILHGELETVSGYNGNDRADIEGRRFIDKVYESISMNGVHGFFKMICSFARIKIDQYIDAPIINKYLIKSNNINMTIKSINYDNSQKYRYIVYGKSHVKNNIEKVENLKDIDIRYIILPVLMRSGEFKPISNRYVKFAVFGYGSRGVVQKVGHALDKMVFSAGYEIRIIGSGGIVANYINFTTMCAPHGHFLPREKMSWCAEDIDVFIISNSMGSYRFSTSGSVLEAISHLKPIIHLDNECSNYFNQPDLPIGIKCRDVEEMAEKMADIIKNYDDYREKFMEFRKNILILRDRIRIENQLEDIKSAFTFDDSKQG